MYSCMAMQVYDQLSQFNLTQSLQQTSIISFNTPVIEKTSPPKDAPHFLNDSPDLNNNSKSFLLTPQTPENNSITSRKSTGIRESLWKAFLNSI